MFCSTYFDFEVEWCTKNFVSSVGSEKKYNPPGSSLPAVSVLQSFLDGVLTRSPSKTWSYGAAWRGEWRCSVLARCWSSHRWHLSRLSGWRQCGATVSFLYMWKTLPVITAYFGLKCQLLCPDCVLCRLFHPCRCSGSIRYVHEVSRSAQKPNSLFRLTWRYLRFPNLFFQLSGWFRLIRSVIDWASERWAG